MITSRSLDDLHSKVKPLAQQLITKCAAEGIELLVTCTYRDNAAQNALYARGRTLLEDQGQKVYKVTNAKGGQSAHNYHLALDVVPLRDGKPVWGTSGADLMLWMRVGNIGESVGLEWAGRWRRMREYPHFQWLGGLTIADLEAGKRPV